MRQVFDYLKFIKKTCERGCENECMEEYTH